MSGGRPAARPGGESATLRLAWLVSLTYNLSFITLAACGILRPWMAAVLMPVSSITVILIATLGRPKFNLPRA